VHALLCDAAIAESTIVEQAPYTDKKEKKIFLIYKEIQMGSGAKSYMRRSSVIYDFAPDLSEFPYILYEENFILFFNSVEVTHLCSGGVQFYCPEASLPGCPIL
jgi:hypothetical protein